MAAPAEFFGKRDGVDRLRAVEHREDGLINLSMIVCMEGVFIQHLDDAGDRFAFQ